jgi:hypothetical protein
MSAGPQIDYDALAKQAGATSSQKPSIDYDALAKQAGAISSFAPTKKPPAEEKGILRKVWDALNTPTADFVLPEGVKTADILKGIAFKQLGFGEYMPGVNDENTVDLKKGPARAALQKFVRGTVADTAQTAAGFTSPLAVGTMGAGAATKLPGAAGTVAKALTGTAAAGFTGKGAMDIAEAGTETTPEAWQQRLQGGAMVAGGAAGAGNLARTLAPPLQNLAPRLYRSALKPSTALKEAPKAPARIKTGIEEGITVSAGGLENIHALVDDLNTKVQAKISGGSQRGAEINKFAVTRRLGKTAKQFETQVNPEADLAAISEAGNEFLRNQPSKISAAKAQELKSGTYTQLRGKAYGELKSAQIEAQKALARGIKEELEIQFPEIKAINAREGRLLSLQDSLERAVGRIDNQQLMGLGTPAAGIAAGVATGSAPMGVVGMVLKAVLDNPQVKSRLAINIHRGTKRVNPYSASEARVAAYVTALANAVNESGEKPRD